MSNVAMEGKTNNKHSNKINKSEIKVGVNCKLTLTDARLLAYHALPVSLNQESYPAIERSNHFLQSCIDERMPIYGLNTHFGDQVNFLDPYLKNTSTEQADYYESIHARQENLIRSHSCGLGEPVPTEIVRVAMMLRAHCLSQGYSGVTPAAIKAILAYLNSGITPIVRHYGSIGASGDLIPLAMIAAGIIGRRGCDISRRNPESAASD